VIKRHFRRGKNNQPRDVAETPVMFFILLYKTINSFVQKITLFCTKENILLYKDLIMSRQLFKISGCYLQIARLLLVFPGMSLQFSGYSYGRFTLKSDKFLESFCKFGRFKLQNLVFCHFVSVEWIFFN